MPGESPQTALALPAMPGMRSDSVSQISSTHGSSGHPIFQPLRVQRTSYKPPTSRPPVQREKRNYPLSKNWCRHTLWTLGMCNRNRSGPHPSVRCKKGESCGGLCVDESDDSRVFLTHKHRRPSSAFGAPPPKGSAALQSVRKREQGVEYLLESRLTVVVPTTLRAEMEHGFPPEQSVGGRRLHPDAPESFSA
jgi:hypothetical protein